MLGRDKEIQRAYKYWFLVMYQHWLINCDQYAILMEDVSSGGKWDGV